MKILVLGATGLTGKELVRQALDAGHEVTAFVRDPTRYPEKHPALRVAVGDVSRPETVADAVRGQEAVICAVGPRSSRQPGTVISDAARNLVAAMKANGVQRLVFQSGMMVGEARGTSAPKRLLIGFFGWLNGALKADKQIAERTVRESELAWVLVRPPMIGPGPARLDYLAQEDVPSRLSTLSAADVAHAVLRAATDGSWVHQVIELSNR
jgi:uncharacterized protein YbjT (DUF2867 family)